MNKADIKEYCSSHEAIASCYGGLYDYILYLYDIENDHAIIKECYGSNIKHRYLKIYYDTNNAYIKINNNKYYMNEFIKL